MNAGYALNLIQLFPCVFFLELLRNFLHKFLNALYQKLRSWVKEERELSNIFK